MRKNDNKTHFFWGVRVFFGCLIFEPAWVVVLIYDDTVILLMIRNPAPVEVGGVSHYLQGFIHPRWLFRISEPSTVSHVL